MAELLTVKGSMPIPDYASVSDDLKRRYQIPPDRTLYAIAGDDADLPVDRVSEGAAISPRNKYKDLPDFKRGVQNSVRMRNELHLLSQMLPADMKIITDENYSFLLIENFRLGALYEPRTSTLCMLLPPEYPVIPPGPQTKYGIFIAAGVRRDGVPLKCTSDDYHWGCQHLPDGNTMKEKGWANWCLQKIPGWDPERDDLRSIIFILNATLQHPERYRNT